MKKKYRFVFNLPSYIITFILVIILVIGIIVNILTLSNVLGLESVNKSFDIIATVLMFIILLVTITITFSSHYTLSDKNFAYSLGFSWYKREYSDIVLLREHQEKKILLLYYKCHNKKGEDFVNFLNIKIKPELFKDFVATIKSYNSSVEYELFSESKKHPDSEVS